MTITGSGIDSPTIKTFDLLDQLMTVLDAGTNNVFFWPFLEGSGSHIQTYGQAEDAELDVTTATATIGLDAVTGFSPLLHVGGVHSHQFVLAESPALVGADAANLSFNGTTDTAMSIGCFFLVSPGNSGTLVAKFDVAGTLREYKLDIESNDLRFTVYDESIDAQEGVRTTTALNDGQWYCGITTYGGAGGNGSGQAADDMIIYIDGVAVTDTDIDDANYVDMEGTAAPLMIGATDDKAAPASEFTGRIALPFIVNAELTAANAATINGIGRILLGLSD